MGLSEAMRVTAEAITQCKFEATDPSADEVVLYNILQVRGTLLLVTCAGNGLALCSQLYCSDLDPACRTQLCKGSLIFCKERVPTSW